MSTCCGESAAGSPCEHVRATTPAELERWRSLMKKPLTAEGAAELRELEQSPAVLEAHRSGACGGYYGCPICAFAAAQEKARAERSAGGARRENPTVTAEASRKHLEHRRARARAERKARKAQRRRAR